MKESRAAAACVFAVPRGFMLMCNGSFLWASVFRWDNAIRVLCTVRRAFVSAYCHRTCVVCRETATTALSSRGEVFANDA